MSNIHDILIGNSAPMKEIKKQVELVSPSGSTVLIQGETGAGKEVVAKAIHLSSKRKGKLISINCSAIPSELLESELFGHNKGAFTGAEKSKAGKFELASNGTLFLDEIGDMQIDLQSKLLRALEEKTIQRVGSSDEIPVNFRLICATHQNIEADINTGKFRSDLYYRINVFPINIPPLASRKVDIPDLLKNLCMKIKNDDNSVNLPNFSDSALNELMKYTWPGNVRELRNVIERACLLFPGRKIEADDVKNNLLRIKVPDPIEESIEIWNASNEIVNSNESNFADPSPSLPHPSHYKDWFSFFDVVDLRRQLQDIEIELINAALIHSEKKISKAADLLKLRRTTLIEKMKKLGIE